MIHLVKVSFEDKHTGAFYRSGSFFKSDDVNRVRELEEKGFIEANKKLSTLEKVEEKKTVKRTRKKASGTDVGKG